MPDEPAHTMPQNWNVEVHQQSNGRLRQGEVGQHLSGMDGEQLGNGLQLHDHPTLDQEIQPVVSVETKAIVLDRHLQFALEGESTQSQFVGKACLVRALEKPGAEVAMNLDASRQDLIGEFPFRPPCLRASVVHFSGRQRRPRSCASGFTLLEVMVALAILGLGLSAILSAQAGLYGANVQARNLTQATSAGRCKMDELEAELLGKGYPEADQADEGPCCSGESPPGMICKWNVERVTLPNPPAQSLTDGGVGGGDAGAGGGMGPLGALAGAAANPGALADGGLSALTSTLASTPGPNGQTGAAGMIGMAMNIVYPQLKPLLEASIRRVTLDVVWNEGPIERKLHLVQFVTNPQKGLPPFVPGAGSAGGLAPGGTQPLAPTGGVNPGGFGAPPMGLPR